MGRWARNPLEEKLADPAPKRPLAVTIGAALATLVVIVAVLLGPAVYTCSSSADGLGACLTGRLADLGILPKPAPVVVAEAPDAAAPVADEETPKAETVAPVEQPAAEQPAAEAPSAEQPAAPADQTVAKTEPAPAPAATETAEAPTFGLLRAEPDGSTVIAGSGTPGSEVDVFMNGKLLGKTKVEASGDWVFVPDAPLPDGGVELTLGAEGSDQQSEKSFVVVIDPDHKSEPLVVASTPGQMSEVLQGLDKPMEVASAEPQVETPAPVAKPEVETPAPQLAIEQPAPPSEPQQEATEPQPQQQVAAPDQPAAEPQQQEAEPPASEPSAPAVAEPESESEPEPAVSAAEPAAAEPQAQPAAESTPAPEPQQQPAAPQTPTEVANLPAPAPAPTPAPPAAEPAKPVVAPTPQLAAIPPAIDAIEIDTGRDFFAGSGPDGATVRLYVDDAYVGSTTVEGGRWLIETDKDVLTKREQMVRIDVLKPDSSEVASRAEVKFVVDLPQPEAPVAVAENSEPAPTPAPAVEPIAPAAPGQPAENATPPQPAVEPEQPAAVPQAPASTPAPAEQQPATEPPPTPAAPEQPALAPEQPAAPAPVEAADTDVPTLVAEPVGDPELQRFASGKAIIRRGDNLWTIARRVYGHGIKYTTIYTANSDQIRDPDLIYPGQVFDLPEQAD